MDKQKARKPAISLAASKVVSLILGVLKEAGAIPGSED